jgi:hypothetical protein
MTKVQRYISIMSKNILFVTVILFFQSCSQKPLRNDKKYIVGHGSCFGSVSKTFLGPPSDDWTLLSDDESRIQPIPGFNQYNWNWDIYLEKENVRVRHRRTCKGIEYSDHQFGHSARWLDNLRISLRVELGWFLVFDTFLGGSLWWATDNKALLPLADIGEKSSLFVSTDMYFRKPFLLVHLIKENIKSLYDISGGVVALSDSINAGSGKERSNNPGKSFYITRVLLFEKTDNEYQIPEVSSVSIINGSLGRNYMENDNSILAKTSEGLWRIENGKNVVMISDYKSITGIPIASSASVSGVDFLLTNRGLWRISSYRTAQKICDFHLNTTMPAMLFIKNEAEIYIGMTYYLVRMTFDKERCKKEIFVPAKCSKTEVRDNTCFCTEGSLSGKPCSSLLL